MFGFQFTLLAMATDVEKVSSNAQVTNLRLFVNPFLLFEVNGNNPKQIYSIGIYASKGISLFMTVLEVQWEQKGIHPC